MWSKLRSLARRLRGERRESLQEWAARHGEVVRQEVERILPHLPEEGLLVDVGANIGLFTEAVLAQRPGLRALCFEPVERYHALCEERFQDDPRVEVHRLALSDAVEERTIFKVAHNYGGNSVVTELIHDDRDNARIFPETEVEEETIQCTTWDTFAQEHGIEEVAFVKTDTEGFDYAVLKGLVPFLERTGQRPPILSELLNREFHTRWTEQDAVVRQLFEIGYEEQDLSSMEWIADILFLPAESGNA